MNIVVVKGNLENLHEMAFALRSELHLVDGDRGLLLVDKELADGSQIQAIAPIYELEKDTIISTFNPCQVAYEVIEGGIEVVSDRFEHLGWKRPCSTSVAYELLNKGGLRVVSNKFEGYARAVPCQVAYELLDEGGIEVVSTRFKGFKPAHPLPYQYCNNNKTLTVLYDHCLKGFAMAEPIK